MEGTPVEVHRIGPYPEILVKREDLASPYPGPMFSKIRGVVAHIRKRPENLIGVLDTFHSRAGWAVSYVCNRLGKGCLDFYPRYKRDAGDLRPQQREAEANGAVLMPLKATASWHLHHQAAAVMRGRGYLMPNALKLDESIHETELEAARTPELGLADVVVIPISSGTIAGGVLRNLIHRGRRVTVFLHMGYTRSEAAVIRYLQEIAPGCTRYLDIKLVDEKYQYKDQVRDKIQIDFPASPFYDWKAAAWLASEPEIRGTILFWNIGA